MPKPLVYANIVKAFIISVLFAIATVSPVIAAEEISGNPQVISGDAMEVSGVRIRLFGIDAPELGQTCVWPNKTIDCGNIARTALLDLVAVATVHCRRRAADSGDVWVATCTAGGFDIARNMVHTGWAVTPPGDPAGYKAVEKQAKLAKRGLWRGSFAMPWIWRAGR